MARQGQAELADAGALLQELREGLSSSRSQPSLSNKLTAQPGIVKGT